MPTFKIVQGVKHNGVFYTPGSDIELTASQAKPLLLAGAIAREKVDEPKPEAPAEHKKKGKK
jgi:hypothetical protein